ncbi:MAG: hypothetical protein AABY32_02500 [Nanoarchaeota archaeon]
MKKKQVNFSLPEKWLIKLERLARENAMKEDRNITYLDLIRDAINEKYKLDKEE